IERVQSLREKSLLRTLEPPGLPGELRFGIYECIREFAAEKLDNTAAAAETEARHAAWTLGQAEEWAGLAETPAAADVRARQALADLETALAVAKRIGDRKLEGRVLRALGLVRWDQGEVSASRALYEQALVAHHDAGDRAGEGRTLAELGGFDLEAGRRDAAE